MITTSVNDLPVRLLEHHDFSFLREIGRVFCVFDEQDSGNIAFGVDNGREKLFVKYAGAKTICHNGSPEDAVKQLKKSMPVYHALRHPYLVELRDHFETSTGYAAVFTWFPGECLRSQWAIIYKHLPLQCRLDSLDVIFAFHEHIVQKGYVAIDFYDGSIVYDFSTHHTMICDIDLYDKLPYTNTMGRMWGSSRFMSPEEFEYGAAIDEVTNVYAMGVTAFFALGGEKDRSFEKWNGGKALYEVASKAVIPERAQRYPSISAFRQSWNAAKRDLVL